MILRILVVAIAFFLATSPDYGFAQPPIQAAPIPGNRDKIQYWRTDRPGVVCIDNVSLRPHWFFDAGGGWKDLIDLRLKFETRYARLANVDPNGDYTDRLQFRACMNRLQGLSTQAAYETQTAEITRMNTCAEARRRGVPNTITGCNAGSATQPRGEPAQPVQPQQHVRPPPYSPSAEQAQRVERAREFWRQRWGLDALDVLAPVANAAPRFTIAQNNYAWYLALQGRPSEALPYVNNALANGGDTLRYVNDTAGYIHALLGDFPRSATYYRVALRLSRNAAETGEAQRKIQNVDRKQLPFESEIAFSWYAAAFDAWRIGRRGDALSNARTAISAAPDYWQAQNALAWYLAMEGRIQEALPHASNALRMGGESNQDVNDTAGYIYARMGQFAEAAQYYRRAARFAKTPNESAAYQAKLGDVMAMRVPVEPEAR